MSYLFFPFFMGGWFMWRHCKAMACTETPVTSLSHLKRFTPTPFPFNPFLSPAMYSHRDTDNFDILSIGFEIKCLELLSLYIFYHSWSLDSFLFITDEVYVMKRELSNFPSEKHNCGYDERRFEPGTLQGSVALSYRPTTYRM
jgi:hypothetical protein